MADVLELPNMGDSQRWRFDAEAGLEAALSEPRSHPLEKEVRTGVFVR